MKIEIMNLILIEMKKLKIAQIIRKKANSLYIK